MDGSVSELLREPYAWFLALLAVVIGARVAELLIARHRARAAKARGEVAQRETVFIPMLLLHVAMFPLCALEVIALDRPFIPVLAAISGGALAILFALRVWILRTLGASWTLGIIRPERVVSDGPYRFVRHPNYAVVIGELLFIPLFHTAWATALVISCLNALILAARISAEERMLFEVPGYAEAMGQKPRLLPFR